MLADTPLLATVFGEPVHTTPQDLFIPPDALRVFLTSFEGPLDLLLYLIRRQNVDVLNIPMAHITAQYLDYIAGMQAERMTLAAEYLLMAALLIEIKSRLLLPPEPGEAGPSAEDLAAHLAFQLERLSAMREAAARLMARDQLGRDFFARGLPEEVLRKTKVTYSATLLDLMRAYARIRTKDEFRPYAFDRKDVYTMEDALERMRGLLGYAGEWSDLTSFMPEGWEASPARRRSATAAHFAAILELAKRGQVQIKQGETFAPLMIRRKEGL